MVEFTKYARDKKQNKLEVGHVILLNGTHAVVEKINRFSRDKIPDIEVTLVETNWRGQDITTNRKTMEAKDYRTSVLIQCSTLRDDYDLHRKLLELAETARNKYDKPAFVKN